MTNSYLITGASDGIGLETARLAVASGAAVVMVARDTAKLQAAAGTLTGPVRPENNQPFQRSFEMTNPTDTIRAFYAALSRGDAPAALGLMANDIEWHTMWHYKVDGRGPQKVAEGLLAPLMAEWRQFALTPSSYITEGGTVVSLGAFTGIHGATGKTANAAYAHVWDVAGGEIKRFRQYIDTLAIAEARR